MACAAELSGVAAGGGTNDLFGLLGPEVFGAGWDWRLAGLLGGGEADGLRCDGLAELERLALHGGEQLAFGVRG